MIMPQTPDHSLHGVMQMARQSAPPSCCGWWTKTAELLFCPLMPLHAAHTMWHTANIPGHVLSWDPHQPASCYHPAWHRTQSLVWFDQWNVEIKLDNLVDIFPSIMQHGLTMLVATHDTGPRRYLVSGFVRDFIWCLWQEILTRRALRQSVVP